MFHPFLYFQEGSDESAVQSKKQIKSLAEFIPSQLKQNDEIRMRSKGGTDFFFFPVSGEGYSPAGAYVKVAWNFQAGSVPEGWKQTPMGINIHVEIPLVWIYNTEDGAFSVPSVDPTAGSTGDSGSVRFFIL